jgi:hypothetical protein
LDLPSLDRTATSLQKQVNRICANHDGLDPFGDTVVDKLD